MYKVLIVDDEPWIRKGIRAKIEKHGFQFSGIDEASDGITAIECIDRNPPDIVFVDIKMAKMDGLELIRMASKTSRGIKFIVITGHSEFEFAEKAINNGARGYLLKPIVEVEFVRLVQNMIIELDQESYAYNNDESTIPEITASINNRDLESTLRQILNPKGMAFRIDSKTIVEDETITPVFFTLGLIHIDSTNYNRNRQSSAAIKSIKTFIWRLIEKSLQSEPIHLFDIDKNSPYLLFLISDQKQEIVESLSRKISLQIYTKAVNSGFSITIGTSGIANTLSRDLYLQARKTLDLRLIHGHGKIYHYEVNNGQYPLVNIDNNLSLLDGYIRSFSMDEMVFSIRKMFLPCTKNPLTVGDLRHIYFSILNTLLRILTDFGISTMVLDRIIFNEDVFDYFDSSVGIGEFLAEAIKPVIAKMKIAKPEEQQNDVIHDIQKYVENNYYKQLSIQDLAVLFGFNPNYLSSRFKAKTGTSVTSFINQIRINAACRILSETSKTVLQVSEMVGFNDSSYFHKVFKNLKGMSPQEFRNP